MLHPKSRGSECERSSKTPLRKRRFRVSGTVELMAIEPRNRRSLSRVHRDAKFGGGAYDRGRVELCTGPDRRWNEGHDEDEGGGGPGVTGHIQTRQTTKMASQLWDPGRISPKSFKQVWLDEGKIVLAAIAGHRILSTCRLCVVP